MTMTNPSEALQSQSSFNRPAKPDRLNTRTCCAGANIGTPERIVSGLAGAALTAWGLNRRGADGWLLAGVGGLILFRSATGFCSLYKMLGIDTAHQGDARPVDYFEKGVHVEKSVRIQKSAAELFNFWRNLANLPRFMHHLNEVREIGDGRSHWVARGPGGYRMEWDAKILNQQANELIAWRSLEGADLDSAGSVRFRELGDSGGTQVTLSLEYIPPAGRVGSAIAKLLGRHPEREIEQDLRRFKQLMETRSMARMP